MPRGGSPPQGLWMPPRTATLFVAASDSLDKSRAQADYICDGVADNVQINAALAAVGALGGGKVMLSEGTFQTSDPIVISGDAITLEGDNYVGTSIDGQLLAAGENVIVISGRLNCCVNNLTLNNAAGGGLGRHGIFIEDGCDHFCIEKIDITDCDGDGIHIEGTTTDKGEIKDCTIDTVDGHGIHVTPDAGQQSLRFHIHGNYITGAGGDGIHFSTCTGHRYHIIEENQIYNVTGNGIDGVEWVMECSLLGNYIFTCTADGIVLDANCDNNLIENNFINGCGGYGIDIAAATCTENRVMNNKLIGNTSGAIVDLGVYTQVPTIFVPVPNPSTNIGTHPAEQLTDLLEVVSRFNLCIPSDFQELVTCHAVVVPGGTGNMRRSVATNWGEIASGEAYNTGSDSIVAGEVAVDADQVEAIDIAAAFTAIAPGDMIGVAFTRHGDHANDTVGANCYLLGLRLRYV